jgi:hypothetical protein
MMMCRGLEHARRAKCAVRFETIESHHTPGENSWRYGEVEVVE